VQTENAGVYIAGKLRAYRNSSGSDTGSMQVEALSAATSNRTAGFTGHIPNYLAPVLRVWTGAGEGFDCGNYAGNAYAFLGASSFVTRSSERWKKNIQSRSDDEIIPTALALLSCRTARWDDINLEPVYCEEQMCLVQPEMCDDPNCECDLLPEGCAIRPPKNDVYKRDVFGWGLDVGFTWDTRWRFEPRFTFGYAIGSGDGNPDQDAVETPDGNFRYPGTDGSFRQTGLQDNNGKFSGVNRFHYYGELFRPELSNMHIGTVSLGFPIFESSSVELLWHIYEQVNEAGYLTDADIGPSPNGRDRRLGQEFDLSLGIEEWEWLEIEITAAVFRAGEAFSRPDPRNNREGEIASFFEFKFEYNF